MRIIYDIAWLGECYLESVAGSGVSRVVENVAAGLVISPECEVSFCASRSLKAVRGCLDYLRTQSRFDRVPFLATRTAKLSKVLDNRLRELNTEIDKVAVSDLLRAQDFSWASARKLKLHKRIERQFVARSGRAVEEQKPFDPRWLARADIFHSPLHPLPRQVRGVQRFLTFYDIIPILYPQFCVPSQLKFTNDVLQSIEPEDWVICISQATRNDLCNHVSIDPARVFVTYLAAAPELFYHCDDREKIASARNLYRIPDGPYILSLNNLEPRKNIGHVVRCFARLVQEQNIKDLNLVLVGAKGWLYDEILETISAYDDLRDRIIVTGFVADEDLAALYSDAMAFVFPSFYEGFGLPVLEAMLCGVPVVTSNTSSLPEVVGDAGLMFDPEDVEGTCQALLELYGSASMRETQSAKSLERARQFAWEKCVQETIAAYKTALRS